MFDDPGVDRMCFTRDPVHRPPTEAFGYCTLSDNKAACEVVFQDTRLVAQGKVGRCFDGATAHFVRDELGVSEHFVRLWRVILHMQVGGLERGRFAFRRSITNTAMEKLWSPENPRYELTTLFETLQGNTLSRLYT